MWLDLQLYVAGLTLLAVIYLWVDSKKPGHRANDAQATRVTKTQTSK